MKEERQEIWIVKNDYMPEPGSWILGYFSSKEKAEKALEDAREEYSFSEEDFENFEIVSDTIY